MRFNSKSAAQTQKFAAQLAKKILVSGPHLQHARVLALAGDLGAGKTTFTQGFAKGLGIKHRMVSPTFLIFRSYKLKVMSYEFFYHVDVYRINSPEELETLHFKKILANPKNIVLIEWAGKIKKILPKDAIWINFTHGQEVKTRLINIIGL